jgi:hypothetical protein
MVRNIGGGVLKVKQMIYDIIFIYKAFLGDKQF